MMTPTGPMVRPVALILFIVLSCQTAATQTLAVARDRFAVDGTSRFLVFVSYFNGLSRPPSTLATDLDWLKGLGVDGIRVWPNLGTAVMDANGALNEARIARLKDVIDSAASRGLLVDVSFHREGVCAPNAGCDFAVSRFRQGIRSVAAEHIGRRNVLFDLQNEWDVHGPPISLAELISVRAAVREVNPSLVVTASTTSGYGEARAALDAFDAVAFHGARDSQGRWAEDTGDLVGRIRGYLANTPGRERPVYLQEPNRFRLAGERRPEMDQNTGHYLTAVRNAKRAGAAAWTFHTAACFDLSGRSPFAALLQPGELDVLNGLSSALAAVSWGQ